MDASLSLPLQSVHALLRGFAGSALFWPLWHSCFGGDGRKEGDGGGSDGGDRLSASELRRQWREGDFRALPPIVVVSSEALGGARGAYATSIDTILLAQTFVRDAGEDALVAVILEELGHSVDARVNPKDSPGDEGAIFSALVRQEEVSPIQLAALRTEQDGGMANLNGRPVAVEQSTATVSLVASFSGLRYANDVRVAGKYAYIADFLSPNADVIILDISSADNPTMAGVATGMGNLSDVDIRSTILYATDGSAGLRIIDINSPSLPSLKSTYDSPGDAQDVKVIGNIAYLADGTSGLQIINVSNPIAPVLEATAGVAIGVTGSVSAVDVAGDRAVIVSKGIGTGRLQTLNIGNSKAPTKTGEVSFALEGAASAVQIVGTTAYLAAGNRGLKIFDISNPAAPRQKGEYLYNSTAEVYDIQVVGDYAFLAHGFYGLEIIDVRNPSDPVLAASYKPSTRYFGMSVSNATTSVEVMGNYAYLTVQASKDLGGLWILDVSPFTATTRAPSISLAVSATNSVTEDGAANLLYTFSRTGLTSSALTVNYTVGGTARLVAAGTDLAADYTISGSTSTSSRRTVTFAAGSSTATVTVDPTADTRAEVNETVTLQLAAGVGYTIGTTAAVSGTIRNDDIIGTAANNVLRGTADADLIDGLAGTDTLTGLASADRFSFRFSHSSITAPDRITDFAFSSDKITLVSATGWPLPLPTAFSRAADNPAATFLQLANRVFADANGALAGNQPLAPNAAALVRATHPAISGTYLLINNPASPLNASDDLLINITGHSGTLPAIGTIAANRVFV
ncbi:MAG: bluetail domain-containing putative surface protein [Cyanobacteriota bacterium]